MDLKLFSNIDLEFKYKNICLNYKYQSGKTSFMDVLPEDIKLFLLFGPFILHILLFWFLHSGMYAHLSIS